MRPVVSLAVLALGAPAAASPIIGGAIDAVVISPTALLIAAHCVDHPGFSFHREIRSGDPASDDGGCSTSGGSLGSVLIALLLAKLRR